MLGRLLVFLFLLSNSASARSLKPIDFYFQKEQPNIFHTKPDSSKKFFYSIGTEWFNLFNYGALEDGWWNFSADFLPSSLNMEFRRNVIEKDSAHSYSISLAPQFGISIFTSSDELAEHAALPLLFQYNFGLAATHRSKMQTGYSIGVGPSLNILNAQYYLFKPIGFIAIDLQYTRRHIIEGGKIRFHYIRFGIDPAVDGLPNTGYHINFGLGMVFGK